MTKPQEPLAALVQPLTPLAIGLMSKEELLALITKLETTDRSKATTRTRMRAVFLVTTIRARIGGRA